MYFQGKVAIDSLGYLNSSKWTEEEWGGNDVVFREYLIDGSYPLGDSRQMASISVSKSAIRVRDVFGSSALKEYSVPRPDILSVALKKGFLGRDKIVLRAKHGTVTFQIAKHEIKNSRDFLTDLRAAITP